jgi:hypothetical protein
MKTHRLSALLAALPLFVLACSSTPDATTADSEVVAACEEGDTKSCTCAGSTSGSKTCSSSGKWGSCECKEEAPPAAEPPAEVKPVCAELRSCDALTSPQTFNPNKDLSMRLEAKSKPQLLAELRAEVASGSLRARYLAAALAPAQAGESLDVAVLRDLIANNASIHAAVTRHAATLGFGNVAAYRAQFPVATGHVLDTPVDACSPSLKIRLGKITVTEEDDDVANDEVYCSISATAKDVQELRITPKTRPLDEGESQSFTGDESVVFGQGAARAPGGDITMKYDCFETDSAAGYAAFIKAAADAAKKYGTKVVSADNAGYVSTGADLVSAFLPQILALDSDDHLFVASQTIPVAKQMELAKGASWTLRKSGTHLWSDWDWTLTMEAWGCAANGTKP